jgi:hypothetical protein
MALTVSLSKGRLKFKTDCFCLKVKQKTWGQPWLELADACNTHGFKMIHCETDDVNIDIWTNNGDVRFEIWKLDENGEKTDCYVTYRLDAINCEEAFRKAALL